MIDGNLSCSYREFFACCGVPWYFTCNNKIWLLCGSLIAIAYYFIMVLSVFINFVGLRNRLDVYIHDYLIKRQLHATARVFQAEGNVLTGPVGKIIIWAFLGYWNKVYANVLSWIWPLLLFTFPSYRRTWWFSLWVVVCLLGHIYCQGKSEANRSSSILQ